MTTGYYYLHTESKDLIYKPESCVMGDSLYFDSPFVQRVWSFDVKNREDAWRICIEAFQLGANKERLKELAKKWRLTHEDAKEYVKHVPNVNIELLNNFLKELNILPLKKNNKRFDLMDLKDE